MYKCIIIDDETLARQLIESHLENIEEIKLVASCRSAIEARKVLAENEIDLIFLDIEMPVLNGVDFYHNLMHQPKVIFTTAYRDYAVEGFEVGAIDYLLKPITFPRFLKSIEKFLASQPSLSVSESENEESEKDYIFVNEDRKKVKVNFGEILYIESLKNYIKIKTLQKEHLVKYSISSFEKKIDQRFLRIHRSYIINQEKITAFTKHDIEINDIEIPIGDNYKTQIENTLIN
ncbi:LytR/AlgR family response regulator transcription factor [Aureibacter tunicatorum]|uniref:DNA-binding LytR/AlgR family response regulator n=1 Tax=Aureibacter tunicatorum TaxID=866807 RepID=A0AAE3XT11_9BACT|nr:response regulator [Aureibacter tunicatorum]MDR6241484.1 DNA-binding LytR/AlgR family response regulator [Aureibacter tunicatorum]BDD06673.1 DNA-binding response regulator [Aureibacter tunicatorum]